jgi:hypothetical protein
MATGDMSDDERRALAVHVATGNSEASGNTIMRVRRMILAARDAAVEASNDPAMPFISGLLLRYWAESIDGITDPAQATSWLNMKFHRELAHGDGEILAYMNKPKKPRSAPKRKRRRRADP